MQNSKAYMISNSKCLVQFIIYILPHLTVKWWKKEHKEAAFYERVKFSPVNFYRERYNYYSSILIRTWAPFY